MIGEIGEVIDIVKKNGGNKASTDELLRKDLIEEMAESVGKFKFKDVNI